MSHIWVSKWFPYDSYNGRWLIYDFIWLSYIFLWATYHLYIIPLMIDLWSLCEYMWLMYGLYRSPIWVYLTHVNCIWANLTYIRVIYEQVWLLYDSYLSMYDSSTSNLCVCTTHTPAIYEYVWLVMGFNAILGTLRASFLNGISHFLRHLPFWDFFWGKTPPLCMNHIQVMYEYIWLGYEPYMSMSDPYTSYNWVIYELYE